MKKIIIILAVLFGNSVLSTAQQNPTLDMQLSAMKKIEALVGQWKGTGWAMTREGRATFTQTEDVKFTTGGTTLLIFGRGVNEAGSVVHDAMAVMFFNAETGEYEFQSHLAKGYHTNAWAKVEDDKIIWGFEHPYAGSMRYTISINSDGQWYEVGEMNRDGTQWMQIFEMTLTQQ